MTIVGIDILYLKQHDDKFCASNNNMPFKEYRNIIILIILMIEKTIILIRYISPAYPTDIFAINGHILYTLFRNHHKNIPKLSKHELTIPISQIELEIFQIGHIVITTSNKLLHLFMKFTNTI